MQKKRDVLDCRGNIVWFAIFIAIPDDQDLPDDHFLLCAVEDVLTRFLRDERDGADDADFFVFVYDVHRFHQSILAGGVLDDVLHAFGRIADERGRFDDIGVRAMRVPDDEDKQKTENTYA